jgi:hypothetical protein
MTNNRGFLFAICLIFLAYPTSASAIECESEYGALFAGADACVYQCASGAAGNDCTAPQSENACLAAVQTLCPLPDERCSGDAGACWITGERASCRCANGALVADMAALESCPLTLQSACYLADDQEAIGCTAQRLSDCEAGFLALSACDGGSLYGWPLLAADCCQAAEPHRSAYRQFVECATSSACADMDACLTKLDQAMPSTGCESGHGAFFRNAGDCRADCAGGDALSGCTRLPVSAAFCPYYLEYACPLPLTRCAAQTGACWLFSDHADCYCANGDSRTLNDLAGELDCDRALGQACSEQPDTSATCTAERLSACEPVLQKVADCSGEVSDGWPLRAIECCRASSERMSEYETLRACLDTSGCVCLDETEIDGDADPSPDGGASPFADEDTGCLQQSGRPAAGLAALALAVLMAGAWRRRFRV